VAGLLGRLALYSGHLTWAPHKAVFWPESPLFCPLVVHPRGPAILPACPLRSRPELHAPCLSLHSAILSGDLLDCRSGLFEIYRCSMAISFLSSASLLFASGASFAVRVAFLWYTAWRFRRFGSGALRCSFFGLRFPCEALRGLAFGWTSLWVFWAIIRLTLSCTVSLVLITGP